MPGASNCNGRAANLWRDRQPQLLRILVIRQVKLSEDPDYAQQPAAEDDQDQNKTDYGAHRDSDPFSRCNRRAQRFP